MNSIGLLRVALDGHAFSSPAGGVRRYVNDLATALTTSSTEVQLFAVGGTSRDLPKGVENLPATSRLPTNAGWCLEGLPRAARKFAFDVFHAPAYTAPLWGIHPLVLTIHDVSYERHPEWYPYRRDPLRRAFYRRSARTADVVLTDSEFSKREIHLAYGLAPERIVAIPLGVSGAFAPCDKAIGDSEEPFILHVGDLHPRRNLPMLLTVLAELRQRHPSLAGIRVRLVGKDRGARRDIAERATALQLSNAVTFDDSADDSLVKSLMQKAAVFAYPSLYEGFGLPPLEAMACGTPVVASSAASIPEVVGDAGILVDPLDVRGWTEALHAVLTSPERAAAMRAAGLQRAATFSWERTARETLAVYRGLASRHRRPARKATPITD